MVARTKGASSIDAPSRRGVAAGTTTVRVSRETREAARKLAAVRGESLSQVLSRAVKEEERREMRRQLGESVARLKQDPQAWAAYQAELAETDGTIADGLVDGEWEEQWTHRDAIAR